MEYGKIVKEYVIPKGSDATIDEVWNLSTIQGVPDPNLNYTVEINQRS